MAKSEQVNIDLTARDKASDVIDDVADAAEKLERAEPEITVTADTDKAERALDELGDDARALSRADAEIVLKARVDAAKGELKSLRGELEQTGDKADDTARQLDRVGGEGDGGLKTRGNAIADLTGPLGEASGAASDFAGVFDGLGDIAEDVAGKIGLSAQTAGAISQAVGGLGIAVAAGAAAWSYFSNKAKEAAARQKEVVDNQRKINEAMDTGDINAAANAFVEAYGKIGREARKTGLFMDEFTAFVTGASDAMPDWEANIADWRAGLKDGSGEMVIFNRTVDDMRAKVQGARDDYIAANGAIGEQDHDLELVQGELRRTAARTGEAATAQQNLASKVDSTKGAFDRLRGSVNFEQAMLTFETQIDAALTNVQAGTQVTADEILSMKQAILDVAETAKINPVEVASELEKLERGDYLQVKADVERWADQNPILLTSQVRRPPLSQLSNRPEDIMGWPTGAAAMSTAQAVTVNMQVPRGYRGDLLSDARREARRAGRMYQRNRV